MNTVRSHHGRRQPAEPDDFERKIGLHDRAAATAQKTIALAIVLPLLRQQVREIIESCAPPVLLPTGQLGYRRGRLKAEEEAWVRPWRDALAAVEAALGQPGPDDGGVNYIDDGGFS